jgi:predicted ATPase/DNA-binding CsgD family transcriptional regulator
MATSMIDWRSGNLPVDVTSFVGRRRELAEAKALLPTSRLLTLTGMGGVGKTRLAIRMAADVHRVFPDGAWLVELAGLQDASLLAQTVSAAFGVDDRMAGSSLTTLSGFLSKRQVLLVLDNCEHLLDACAVMTDALLRTCPGLRVLATSRQPLGIAGEQTLIVPPLSVPEADPGSGQEGLTQYGAVSLFLDRASAVRPGFTIDAGNQRAVAGICRRLDGIPLAIELAVGRLRSLSVDQLLERLDHRYALLTGGSRAAMPRQQTLQALIDWSFDLCSPAEQLLWARLSVFSEGFDLDSVEEVCCDGEIRAGDVLDLIAGLVEKSVVVADERGGRVRYQLSETLREYGRDRLTNADQTRLRRRHPDRYANLVIDAEAGWFGPRQVELFGRLRLEHANLRAALGFCLTEPGGARVGLGMATALRFYWFMSGRPAEGHHWLGRLLASELAPTPLRIKALCVDAYLATLLNDFPAVAARLDEALSIAQKLRDSPGIAYVTQVRGLSALFQGDPLGAVTHLEQALAEHRAVGDEAAMAYDGIQLAVSLELLGEHERAVAQFEQCLTTSQARGEHWIRALALWALGIAACRHGDYTRSTSAEQESIRLKLPLDDRLGIALSLDVLAWTAAASGKSERAARLLGAAQAIREALGASLAPFRHLAQMYSRYELSARQSLGEVAFDLAFKQGLELGFDNAVAYALGETRRPAARRQDVESLTTVAGSLTRREHEVAELIARGMSNKEIAGKLVISQRTAEAHVEHILTKLGFTSRVQVAAWATDNRGTTSDGRVPGGGPDPEA